ncbi:pre-toxin TG domain-containing protein [Salipaludibacillus sp. LMS25]|uniref:pre-toxin TG domain-containing protein n=1 Tax=Salipaludibacillus sp. LMS25 TaxID=2924031 RepID=UPI0020D0A3AD|nr:pre-toxin TG domain-containing protein [Salipaludibacillus sp. LMS25]UTR15271.1 pre-toxin TG domain-containing protein [Salipaludibacillus sp. LMS25]
MPASSAYNYVTANPTASLSTVVDFVPVVGNLNAGIESVTGRRLEPWERAVPGGAILGGTAVKGASLRRIQIMLDIW